MMTFIIAEEENLKIKSNGMCIFVIQIGFDWIMHYSLSQSKYIDNQHIKRSLNKID